jgi:hypothetical protein
MAWMTALNEIILGDQPIAAKTTFECRPEDAKSLDALNAARPATADEIRAVKPDFDQPSLPIAEEAKGKVK